MKTVTFLFFFAAFAKADIDWSSVEDRRVSVDLQLLPIPLPVVVSQTSIEKENRIVGGEEANPNQFPHQAALLLKLPDGRQGFCGGSVISKNYILTAAHCLQGVSSAEVILGAHNVKKDEPSQLRLNCTDFIIHENYNAQWVRNDIALIKLPHAIEYNDHISPITLPSSGESRDFVGDKVVVSGWGKVSDSSDATSSELRYINTTIISNKRCFLSFPFLIHASHICASGQEGKSSCNGDSGGPLSATKDGNTFQIALVSFGRATGCEKGYPAVFTRLSYFLSWIEKHTDVHISQ